MKKILLLNINFLLFLSCATENTVGKTEAEILYREAKTLIKDERFILATEKLNQLKNRYPYSYYATPAELLQADILFEQENFSDAAAAFLLFKDFHPKHKKIPYVVYKIAESFFAQVPETNDRDLESAIEAIKYYREILISYTSSNYAKDAKSKIKKCEEMLVGKEQRIADFYYKVKNYDAAIWRYLDILDNIGNKKIRKHSMIRLVRSSKRNKAYRKCISYADTYFQFLEKEDRIVVEGLKMECKKKLN